MAKAEQAFDGAAAYYSARTPYLPVFFSHSARVLALSKQSFVLDLACGTGELAAGFAPHCDSVVAIDKSPNMLSAGGTRPDNVRFVEADLDGTVGPFPALADLVTIGRAIHLLRKLSII